VLYVKGQDLDEVWKKTNDRMFFHDEESLARYGEPSPVNFQRPGVSLHSFHNTIVSETAETAMELLDFGYTKTKWSMLMRLYFDPVEFVKFIHRLQYFRQGKRGKQYVPDIAMPFKVRDSRLGACLLAICVRFSRSQGWEAEVFTRANEVTSRWGVDLIFAHVFLKTVGSFLGFRVSDVRVYWNSSSMFQGMVTTPLYLFLAHGEEEIQRLLKAREEGTKVFTKWQDKALKRYGDSFAAPDPKYQSFKTQRRATKAYKMARGEEAIGSNHPATKDLSLPYVDMADFEKGYFERKGFR